MAALHPTIIWISRRNVKIASSQMSDKAAIHAEFEDVKRVKTRKVWQLIFEVPEERYDAAIEALGGSPQSGASRPVAIALLKPESVSERPKGGERAKRAGILCNNPSFFSFLHANYSPPPMAMPGLSMEGDCAAFIRDICDIPSRADLDHNAEAACIFDRIVDEFYQHQRGESDDLVREQMR